jgi:hypothetical protein
VYVALDDDVCVRHDGCVAPDLQGVEGHKGGSACTVEILERQVVPLVIAGHKELDPPAVSAWMNLVAGLLAYAFA